jgi:hypothetical protein
VEVLADAVGPITLEDRWKLLADYTTSTRLDRLVDTAVLDGERPRAFTARVRAFLADPSDEATYRWLDAELRAWVANHQHLTDLVSRSALLKEIAPISQSLSEVADVGLRCLGALHASRAITPEEWKVHQKVLESASVPMAEVTLPNISGIRALLESVSDNAEIISVDMNSKESS